MLELIVAGVRAGLRSWRPWGRDNFVALFFIVCASVGFFDLHKSSLGWDPLEGVILVVAGAWYVSVLYASQFPSPERALERILRLLASWALAALFMVVLGSLFFVVLLCTLYAVASAGHGFDPSQVRTWAPAIDARGKVVASAVFILGVLALGWAAMRVWLASAATAAERRVAMLSTWPFTRGRVVPMTVARLVLSVPAILLMAPAFFAWRNAIPPVQHLFLAPWIALVIALAWFPMQAGAAAEYYRRRVLPPEPDR